MLNGIPVVNFADVTPITYLTNLYYIGIVSILEILKKIHYMVSDPVIKGFQIVFPIRRYKSTPEERLKLVDFYESALGQVVYSRRRTSIEPLIEHIKSTFRIGPVPVRGYDKVHGIILLSVLLYQILVYYNCKGRKEGSLYDQSNT